LWRAERATKSSIINGGIHAAVASRAVGDAVNGKTVNSVSPKIESAILLSRLMTLLFFFDEAGVLPVATGFRNGLGISFALKVKVQL
jgi:hypothetical protein